MPVRPRPILIGVGELSGDQRGAELLAALRERVPVAPFGVAGPALVAAGVEPLEEVGALATMGIAEVVGALPRLLRLHRRLLAEVRSRRPAAALLVDYGGYHTRLGRALRRLGVPVFHLAPPKVWAWGARRLERLAESVDAVGVFFPFERRVYPRVGIRTIWVGHPAVAPLVGRSRRRGRRLLVLPGSRPGEVARHLALLVAAARRLAPRLGLEPLVVRAPTVPLDRYRTAELEVRTLGDPRGYAEGALALAASGTVNLELAALGVPQVVVYRAHPVTAAIARRMVRLRWVNPLNLAAEAEVVPELLQEAATVPAIVAAGERVWAARRRIARRSREVARSLVRPEGLAEAAEVVASWLR